MNNQGWIDNRFLPAAVFGSGVNDKIFDRCKHSIQGCVYDYSLLAVPDILPSSIPLTLSFRACRPLIRRTGRFHKPPDRRTKPGRL